VKATGGSVNVPVVVGGQIVRPGDVILADDDGVVCVPREDSRRVAEDSAARERKEALARAAFLDGELGLDRYGLRETLVRLGVTYTPYDEYVRGGAAP
jgi:4-hydroxy-4-methyl-2-oxoglutarate aldolase